MSIRARVLLIVVVVVVVAAVLVLGRRPQPEGAVRAAFDAEFLTRPDGYPGLSECYGFSFRREPMQMDPGLMYKAVADGAVDVIDGFATDGRIRAYDLVVLEDDRGFFPPYHAAPLVREETLREHPEIGEALGRLAGEMADEAMQQLNYRVDEQGEKACDVARDFLVSRGLLAEGASAGSGEAGRVVIGSKHFTEQELLGEMMAALIECTTDVGVVRKLNLGGTMICFNALEAGDLDLYAEYTGTGLVNILKRDVIADPDETYACVKQAFKDEYGLVWLEPFGFNNTYTLTMREDHARELGVETISDLAAHVRARGGQG